MTYTPDYRWLIDWDDDDYQNPLCDVTDYVASGKAKWGSEPHLDGRSVAVSHGTGRLVLYNTDDRYNPDSTSALLDENILRRSHRFKVVVGSILVRQGLCEREGGDNKVGGLLTFGLKGVYAETITRGGRTLLSEGKTLSGLGQQFSTDSGINLLVGSEQPTGHVVFEGSWLYFLQDLSVFGGGWVLERADGEYVFRRWSDSPDLPLSATLSAEYGYLEDSFRFREEDGHVRNSAECTALVWSASESSVLAYASLTMSSGQQRPVTLVGGSQTTSRPAGWSAFTLSDTANFSLRMAGGSVEQTTPEGNPNARTVYVIPGAFSGFRTVTVVARGSLERRRKETSRELTVDQYGTMDVFGDRPLRLPPWFPGDYDGIETYTRPYLTNLSQPPRFIQLTYPERQDTPGKWELLNGATNPGNAVDVEIVVSGESVVFPMLVLSTEISGGYAKPYRRTVTGIRRQAVPEAPLVVGISEIGDVEAYAFVGVPNPRSTKSIYGRRRTS